MVRVSTFCPRCGESIETDVPEEARVSGRAELSCPACRFEFVIAPARRNLPTEPGAAQTAAPEPARPGETFRATGAARSVDTRGRPLSFKPLAAGLMLVFSAVIGIWMGSVLILSDDLVETGFAGMEGEGAFTGRVLDAKGAPLGGVRVEVTTAADGEPLDPLDRPNTTTGPDGRYAFDGLEPGVHTFRFTHPNHTTVLLVAPAYPADYSPLFGDASTFGRVTMEPGDPATERNVSRMEEFETLARGWGWFTLVAATLALVGSWACLRRRGFALAVVGAICGVLTFGFVIGSAVALIALILILFSRKEFAPLRSGA